MRNNTTTTAAKIRIVIADDHALFRSGIQNVLEHAEEFAVVGEAADEASAVTVVEQLQPDVLLNGLQMKAVVEHRLTRHISRDFPTTRIIVIDDREDREAIALAFRAGASGYMSKRSTEAALRLAIATVATGRVFLGAEVAQVLVDELIQRQDAALTAPRAEPSPRQTEVLRLIAQGFSSKEVARRLNLSAKTVDAHRNQLMMRLGIHSVAGLVQYAIRSGLVEVDSNPAARTVRS